MANFRWTDTQNLLVGARYRGLPFGDVIGIAQWERLINRVSSFQTSTDALPWLEDIRAQWRTAPPRRCPRLFVSHRQDDEALARRVAWCANQEGVEYWLDVVHLPSGAPQQTHLLSTFQQAVLTAAIIEIALINCTHVIAVMTPKTAGSRWVPYEYGRIKDDPPALQTASCWLHPDLVNNDLPEYLYLAPIFASEPEIRAWIATERQHFKQCIANAAGTWPDNKIPDSLPLHGDVPPQVIISTDP